MTSIGISQSQVYNTKQIDINCNGSASDVTITRANNTITVRDATTGAAFTKPATGIQAVVFFGGAGNDTVRLNIADVSLRAYGFGGSDRLYGNERADHLDGGTGNDSLFGYGGNDKILGGAGRGALNGGAGDDYLNGGDDFDTNCGSQLKAMASSNPSSLSPDFVVRQTWGGSSNRTYQYSGTTTLTSILCTVAVG